MILGAVLAGGRSSRFGSDKAQALWHGQPLVDHVIERLASISSTVIVCGRRHDRTLSIIDRPRPDLGPLGGLNAALRHGAEHGYDRVVSVPCDTPSLGSDLLAALAAAECDLFLADMPVIGSWRTMHADKLDRFIGTGGSRSMHGWAEAISAMALHIPAPININRPSDLADLDRGAT